MVENIRRVYPEKVLCYLIGSFYQCFEKDAYILSYLFGYKIKYIKQDIPMIGFPKNALAKVQALLEHQKIDYIFLDTRNNYDVDFKNENGNLNKYKEVSDKASNYVKIQLRIERNI